MVSSKIIGILVSVFVVCLGIIATRYAKEMREWHIRQFFGRNKPEDNWFYRQMITPSSITTNKISGVAFILAGLLLLLLSLLK